MLHGWMLTGISPDGVCVRMCVFVNLASSVFAQSQIYPRRLQDYGEITLLIPIIVSLNMLIFSLIQTEAQPVYIYTYTKHRCFCLTCIVLGFFQLYKY